MGRAEWQGGQEGSCPKPSTEQTLITDQQPHLCRLPCQLDVRPKDTGHSGWQVFVAQKAVLLCQGSQELPKWGSMRWGDIREMASQAGAHLSLQNTSIYAPLPHPHVSLPLGFSAKRRLPARLQRGWGVGRKWALPLACLTVPDPLLCVTPRRTSLAALNLQSLSFEG